MPHYDQEESCAPGQPECCPTAPPIDYEAKYLALREKHNRFVMRLEQRVDGSRICLDILKALDGFTAKSGHMPAIFLRAALEETLKQMALHSPLTTPSDVEE